GSCPAASDRAGGAAARGRAAGRRDRRSRRRAEAYRALGEVSDGLLSAKANPYFAAIAAPTTRSMCVGAATAANNGGRRQRYEHASRDLSLLAFEQDPPVR